MRRGTLLSICANVLAALVALPAAHKLCRGAPVRSPHARRNHKCAPDNWRFRDNTERRAPRFVTPLPWTPPSPASPLCELFFRLLLQPPLASFLPVLSGRCPSLSLPRHSGDIPPRPSLIYAV